jgi:ABC-2 type transport system permease protein
VDRCSFGVGLSHLLLHAGLSRRFPLILLAFAGGLFIPLSQFPHVLQTIAKFTPLYGLNELVHAPLTGTGIELSWVVNVLVWLAIFAGGAMWRFRKDTARV